ncbi:MAG: DUF2075 domain-containing protein [Euryarchaeota archaeon]|nr:DUF2075 domain-containing protein [Euryarchaeota archaeon]
MPEGLNASAGHIPREILRFFESKGGHSLIVKGEAGTGKTTLALQLIEELSGAETTHYLSERVGDASLYNQFPWLARKARATELMVRGRAFLDVLYPRVAKRGARKPKKLLDEAISLLGTLNRDDEGPASVNRTELKKLEGQIVEGEADMSAPEDFGELKGDTLTFDLTSELPEIEYAYEIVDRALPRKSLIVMDSIDSLSEKYGVAQRRLVTTMQKDLVELSGANIVYVTEEAAQSQVDYLGDGVITLESSQHEDRRLRKLRVDKLRGCPVHDHTLTYTLAGGRMTIFEKSAHEGIGGQNGFEQIPDGADGAMSTGCADLDSLIGGFGRGTLNLIEFDEHVAPGLINFLCYSISANFALHGRGVCMMPPAQGTSETAHAWLAGMIGQQRFERNVRVLETQVSVKKDRMANVILLDGSSPEMDIRWDNFEYNLSEVSGPLACILSLDALNKIYSKEVMGPLSQLIYAVRKSGAVFIGFSTRECVERSVAASADTHLRIDHIGGQSFVYGEKPYTILHGAVLDKQGGRAKLSLLPVL